MELKRNCPKCYKQIEYKTKSGYIRSAKTNCFCRQCSTKAQYINNPNKNKGTLNGRYGKKLIDLMTPENYKSFQEKLKLQGFKEGELNPQYGKAPPKDAGKGYQGWYKNLYFRSTLELNFLLNFEEKNGFLPFSAEKKKYIISYGDKKTYRPDFVCEVSKVVFEIKSKKFINSKENIEKANNAICHFLKMDYKYIIITEENLNNFIGYNNILPKLKIWHETNLIKLTNKSLQKLLKRLS